MFAGKQKTVIYNRLLVVLVLIDDHSVNSTYRLIQLKDNSAFIDDPEICLFIA